MAICTIVIADVPDVSEDGLSSSHTFRTHMSAQAEFSPPLQEDCLQLGAQAFGVFIWTLIKSGALKRQFEDYYAIELKKAMEETQPTTSSKPELDAGDDSGIETVDAAPGNQNDAVQKYIS